MNVRARAAAPPLDGHGSAQFAERLCAALRPEFAAEVIVPAQGDPVLGMPACAVPGCDRSSSRRGWCQAHFRRWDRAGRPGREQWATTADPATWGHRPLRACRAPGCRFSQHRDQLCYAHSAEWRRHDRPSIGGWLAGLAPAEHVGSTACAVGGCELLAELGEPGLCRSHRACWRAQGRPAREEFLFACASYGEPRFDLRGLTVQTRLEIQYILQCRVDERRTRTTPGPIQRRVREWHRRAEVLFPRATGNPDGCRPVPTATFNLHLKQWLSACRISDELGEPAHVTAHRFRHTYASRLINSEVSQEVVRRLLDHTSHAMTARYARLADTTIREQWERAQKINIRGEPVEIADEGALADGAWMKQNLARWKMALPNGYCGLPLQKSCPHANACLTCPPRRVAAIYQETTRDIFEEELARALESPRANARRNMRRPTRRRRVLKVNWLDAVWESVFMPPMGDELKNLRIFDPTTSRSVGEASLLGLNVPKRRRPSSVPELPADCHPGWEAIKAAMAFRFAEQQPLSGHTSSSCVGITGRGLSDFAKLYSVAAHGVHTCGVMGCKLVQSHRVL